jgi:hypothetical protein
VQAAHHRHDLEHRRAGPVGEDLAADLDPLAGQDLRLAIQRQVIGVAGHQDIPLVIPAIRDFWMPQRVSQTTRQA